MIPPALSFFRTCLLFRGGHPRVRRKALVLPIVAGARPRASSGRGDGAAERAQERARPRVEPGERAVVDRHERGGGKRVAHEPVRDGVSHKDRVVSEPQRSNGVVCSG